MEPQAQQAQYITADALEKVQHDYFGQFLLDNSKFLEEMYHKLRGENLTEEPTVIDGQTVLMPKWKNIMGIKPIINDKGLNTLMYSLNLSLTTNAATGKMDDEVLRVLAYKTYVLVMKDMYLNYEEYGFENLSHIHLLGHLIFKNVLLHLSKSTDMALLKELFSSYNIHEVRQAAESKPQQHGGLTI